MGLFVRKTKDGKILVSRSKKFDKPPPKRHRFGERWIKREMDNGWVTLSQGKLILHLPQADDVVYKIVRTPGSYCLHCGEKLSDDPARTPEEATRRRQYTKACSKNRTPHLNTVGYEQLNAFEGVLVDDSVPNWRDRLLGRAA